MQNLKTPILLMLSMIATTLMMRFGMQVMGYDQALHDAQDAAQALGNPEQGAELLAREWQRTHPGQKLPRPHASGSMDEAMPADFAD